MSGFMIRLGYMSLQGTFIICVVLLIRKVFSAIHISKKYSMFLWMIVFFFFAFPWKITSPAGFWSNAPADYELESLEKRVAAYEEKQGMTAKTEWSNKKKELADRQKNLAAGRENMISENEESRSFIPVLQNGFFCFGILWGSGIAFLVLYNLIGYWKLKRNLLCSIDKGDFYFADNIQVPMVLGVFKTKIYIPSGMEESCLEYVIEHERTHIRRKDTITKTIAYFITCIHWFNPFVWFAYHLMVKDMEMACDEETVQRIGIEKKKKYAVALLQVSIEKRNMFAVPLAFGEGDTKSRIKNVLRYQKTVKVSAALAIIAGVAITLVFLTKGTEGNVSGDMVKQEENKKTLNGQETSGKAEEGELTFEMVRNAFAKQNVDQIDFSKYANGEKEKSTDDDTLNYYIWFDYNYKEEKYRLGVSYDKNTDNMENIYITRISDSEMSWLYTVDDGEERYPNDLEEFLSTRTKIDDWLTIKLPKGYKMDSYRGDLGVSGGACISPESYVVKGDAADVPKEWRQSGFVGRIEDAGEQFLFQEGELSASRFPLMNHSWTEEVEVLNYLDWPAIMVHYYHDLYTAEQKAELEKEGIELTETTSEYWYFFFVKEGEKEAYYLTLSAKEFSKKEAIAIAKTVRMR